MKSARNQFILVGFLCQGLAWESGVAYWLVVSTLWVLALGPLLGKVKMTPNGELAALIGGAALSILIGKIVRPAISKRFAPYTEVHRARRRFTRIRRGFR